MNSLSEFFSCLYMQTSELPVASFTPYLGKSTTADMFAVGLALILLLRESISDMFYASCSGECGYKHGRSIGRRIQNKQNVWGIITRSYMKPYICGRLKKPFKLYLYASRCIELLWLPSLPVLFYVEKHEFELRYAGTLLTIIILPC